MILCSDGHEFSGVRVIVVISPENFDQSLRIDLREHARVHAGKGLQAEAEAIFSRSKDYISKNW